MDISTANEAQKQAILHQDGPLLVVAGAGTGKTRVITQRIAWLIIEQKVNPDRILALTFTDKASEEMAERVDKELPYGYVDLWISTFHSFCDKILRRHGLDIGLTTNYKLVNQTQAWILIHRNIERFNLDYYRPMGNPTKFIHALINHFSRCKDEGILPADYLKYAEEIKLNSDSSDFIAQLDLTEVNDKDAIIKNEILRLEEISNAYHVYQQILLENESLDFADLMLYTIELFKKRPALLEQYRQQFQYILVDEFQDTNFIQYQLIKMLSAPKNNLMVVGDDDQSIYRFRGSSIENIMQFKADFPQVKEVVLTSNYRSAQQILDKAYEFIAQNNPHRLEVSLNINKKLNSQIEDTGLVEHLHFDRVENEIAGVVNKIIEIKQNDKDLSWSDFAILIRANSSAEAFTQAFAQAKVPYQFLALKGLYNKPIILDIINYFKLLDNYHENSAVYRILNLPIWQIEPNDITKIIHFAGKKAFSVFEVLQNIIMVQGLQPETYKKINIIISQINHDSGLAQKQQTSEIFVNFLNQSGYLEYLKTKNDRASHLSYNYLNQFYLKIQDFENTSFDKSLRGFMELITLELESGESGQINFNDEEGPDMVRIMTVHTAKGLEFKYVFIVNLVDRKFPSDERSEPILIPTTLIKESINTGDFHLEEERRLFYVAMTRAKIGLFFTSAENYGGSRKKKISRFLIELGYDSTVFEKNKIETDISSKQLESNILASDSALDKTEMPLSMPKHFSFSALNTYSRCPYQFYFAKMLKIPTFGKPALTFGDVMHRTIKDFLEMSAEIAVSAQTNLFGAIEQKTNAKKVIDEKQLLDLYQKNWRDDWYPTAKLKEDYFKKGQKILKTFRQDFIDSKPDIRLVEHSFNVKIGQFKILGRIDRMDNVEGGVEIIDYKTGSPKTKEKLSIDDKRQLILYQIATEQVFGLKPAKLTYQYLENNTKVSFLGTDKQIINLKNKFLEIMTQVQTGNFIATPEPNICKFCDYQGICEYKKL
ncbi:hypothetical protein A2533_04055 [Candidatus Falkowbacteria bacterium RIFOXYD2_FULL_35_9]|uniref:DNA 3'-5' helicase n=1 Tax=Candidatus Falkowbacteria bacterium RIFOXYC2_FULL_36_12 TaxID=1798002 RepID=A0A1F5SYA2_9BACT|nr:MAG: hypothetical protein A2300_00390 [Candidatus Falkowbacteria bacterium RIFOXYB2_FULL_35_7]OGF31632.1 MAG: hypothetical protein A2478_04050 [Candidatus Falkowbacteria bacterium RIFOXYC2_FULL_36_12]OGF34178.1 MAG: hypothetical protein A2223_01980 [Candidatus Falkowbacteria bacterium RIFOXYA2_FULL_35_8]OGF46700.1 MAG: hypothetical protein A2533_04055 [Candidatus Falkowbacteria bacterium RIFOXYD2_FULL_35_9]